MTSTPLTFRGRLWRWTKRLTFTATLMLFVSVPAAYYGLPKLAAHPKAKAKVEKSLGRALGTPVRVGTMSFDWKTGLQLRDVATADHLTGCSFRVDSVTILPRWHRLLKGKVRLQAEIERPEVVMIDAGTEIRNVRLPKFGRKGIVLDGVKVVDGTYILKSGRDDRTVRIDGITTEGTGRLQNRTIRMELKSVAGSVQGTAMTGKGALRLSQDGFAGEVEVNEDAAQDPTLQDAFRAARVTLKKAPVMSEPF